MPQGLQVWNAAGQLVLDLADKISRLSGTVTVAAGATGSLTIPNTSQGTVWYAALVNGGSAYAPVVSVSGSTLQWQPGPMTPAAGYILLYGVF
jgi:hypothetical protein